MLSGEHHTRRDRAGAATGFRPMRVRRAVRRGAVAAALFIAALSAGAVSANAMPLLWPPDQAVETASPLFLLARHHHHRHHWRHWGRHYSEPDVEPEPMTAAPPPPRGPAETPQTGSSAAPASPRGEVGANKPAIRWVDPPPAR